jgi:disulfide oxidoreductase YuzD
MKILHVGDTAGMPVVLRGIDRKNGDESAIVVTCGNKLNYQVDFKFLLQGKNTGSIKNMLKYLCLGLKYNRVHFHKKTIFNGLDLLLYKLLGKEIVIHYHGSDIRNKQLPWYNNFADIIYVSTPDLLEFVPGAKWLPNVAIDYELPFEERKMYVESEHKFRILHCPTNPEIKGTKYIEAAIKYLEPLYDFEYVTITGQPHEHILQAMAKCDLYIDQVLIGFYGVSAMECAAMGVPVMCYVMPLYKHPFINVHLQMNDYDIYDMLEFILANEYALPMVSEREKKYYQECRGRLEIAYNKDKRCSKFGQKTN